MKCENVNEVWSSFSICKYQINNVENEFET